MANYLILSVSILLAVVGQLLMKHGMNQFGTFAFTELPTKIIPMIFHPFVFAGLAAFGFSSIFWLFILSRMQLSLVYPMVSVAYVLVALASLIIFKENVSVLRWASIAVICFGVVLISRS